MRWNTHDGVQTQKEGVVMTRNLSFSRNNFRFALVIGLTLSLLFIFGLAPSDTGVISAEEPPRQEYVPGGVPIANQNNPTAQMAIDALDLVTSEVNLVDFDITDHTGLKIYSAPLSDFPTAGNSFMIMSTGCAAAADYPDDPIFPTACVLGIDKLKTPPYLPGLPGTDMVQMTIDLTPPPGATSFQFDWKLFSEKFPDFVGFGYNDTFIVETPASTFAIDLGPLYYIPTVSAPNNIAFDGSGNLISINSTGVYGVNAGNAVGTIYNGATALFTTTYSFAEGTPSLTFVFSLMDLGDDLFDTSVFLDNLRWGMDTGGPMTNALENCANGFDDDGDGLIDGNDPDCTPTDTAAPILTMPTVMTVECGASGGVNASNVQIQYFLGGASASDSVDPAPVITNDAPSFLPLGTNLINFTAADASGNSSNGGANISVVDTTPPTVTASLDLVSNGDDYDDADDEAPFVIGLSASDICDPSLTVSAVLKLPNGQQVSVSNLDVIEFEFDDEGVEIEFEDGELEIEAPSMILEVTAMDASGNMAVATAQPVGLNPDNDDETEDDD